MMHLIKIHQLFKPFQKDCQYEGVLDDFSNSALKGWARCKTHPGKRVSVDIYNGDALIERTVANEFRQDLLDAGKGDGKCGFQVQVPKPFTLEHGEIINAKIFNSGYQLLKGTQFAGQAEYSHILKSIVGQPPWCLDAVEIQENSIEITGWAIPPGGDPSRVAFTVNDKGFDLIGNGKVDYYKFCIRSHSL